MSRPRQVLLASVPLLLTPAVVYGLSEGVLGVDGGEKDVLLALPWLIGSISFAICAYVLIYRHWPVGKWMLRSALVSLGVLVALWIVAFVISAQ